MQFQSVRNNFTEIAKNAEAKKLDEIDQLNTADAEIKNFRAYL